MFKLLIVMGLIICSTSNPFGGLVYFYFTSLAKNLTNISIYKNNYKSIYIAPDQSRLLSGALRTWIHNLLKY